MKKSVLIFLVAILALSCSKEKKMQRRNMTVVFYNVENLFDLQDEPEKWDEEFTPAGEKKWDQKRYDKKLHDLARVLTAVNEDELPEIVGLCEVENKKVLQDLIGSGELANGKYSIVHNESPDFRGIDCALIYRPAEFKVLYQFPVTIRFKDDPDYTTRDILYVKGRTKNREKFHIFVNHWPSRIGGLEKTEPNRVEVASVLKSKIDSIYQTDANAKIIVMGDMNDEPNNKSLLQTLGAKSPENESARLVNLMFPLDNENKGTYNYRGNWNMIDNMVVSKSLLDNKGFQVIENSASIFRKDWMEYKNNEGKISPNRTYGGPNYYGGISDHFPVYFSLKR